MIDFREVNDDILADWLLFREETFLSVLTDKDKEQKMYFERFSDNILKNVSNKNKNYVRKQLDLLYDNFVDYLVYWNEKYYRNGFVDGVQLLGGCLEK